MKVRIGKIPDTGKDFNVDLESLIESKLIIQAVSGGGKSYAIRKLIEIACGKKQSIIFDREAEFGSLRDKFDFVLAGPDGDIPADIKSAEILARKTLEHGYSLIIDLSEMTKNDKFVYVQRFIEAMLSAKKDLWRDVLVVIDEAHEFAPEGGKGTSPCKEAVVNLASLGRKRGFCGVFGTQRISKLSKDVVAECQNKLIGKTVLDIDRKRAADELGFNTQAKEISLRQLTNGEFYAFGPALSDDVLKIKIDQVVTKHGKEAKRMQKVAKPTAKVREMLARLTDLPAEATKELRDKESMMAEIKSLNQKLKEVEKANKAVPVPKAAVVTSDQIKKIQEQIELSVRREYEKSYREKYKSEMSTIKSKIADILQIRTFGDSAPLVKVPEYKPHVYAPPVVNQAAQKRKEILRSIPAHVEGDLKPIAKMGREILSFMSTSPDRQFKRTQIGALAMLTGAVAFRIQSRN